MREIKFRGLRTDGKGWVIGVPFFIHEERKCFMIDNCQSGNLTQEDSIFNGYEVHRKSVGQFTGLNDKNGKEISEGDKVISFKKTYEDEPSINIVEFVRGCFMLVCIGKNDIPLFNYEPNHLEIIGNIHQESEVTNG